MAAAAALLIFVVSWVYLTTHSITHPPKEKPPVAQETK
jgi:hypothetical protein